MDPTEQVSPDFYNSKEAKTVSQRHDLQMPCFNKTEEHICWDYSINGIPDVCLKLNSHLLNRPNTGNEVSHEYTDILELQLPQVSSNFV